jgi:RNA polymerase sigma-70 factor (ECF subfamily)
MRAMRRVGSRMGDTMFVTGREHTGGPAVSHLTELSDHRLAELARNGRHLRAFAVLSDRHRPGLWRYSHRIIRDHDAADDVVQETFLRAYTGLPHRSHATGVRPWLYTIAHNIAIDRRRLTHAQPLWAEHSDALASDIEIHGIVAARLEASALLADLRTLPSRQREVVIAHELNDVTFRTIAAQLNIKPAAARQAATDARRTLQQLAAGRDATCQDVHAALASNDGRTHRKRWIQAHRNGCRNCAAHDTPGRNHDQVA